MFRHRFILLNALIAGISLSSCSGGGSEDSISGDTNTTPTNAPTTTGVAPKVIWRLNPGLKNPVTDLVACSGSVMTCIKNDTALRNCIGNEVSVCPTTTPTDGCCTQACGDQLIQQLNSGKNEQDAYLEVFVYDGSCMPGVSKSIGS